MKVARTGALGLLLLYCLFSSMILAQEPSEEELERWFENDDQIDPVEKRGGGEQLELMAPDASGDVPLSHTWLILSPRSVQSGWVAITQCHEALDAVPDAEVVYRFKQMRGLRVTEAVNIGRVWVEGQSVQLKDVGERARLCTGLEANILNRQGEGRYLLRYGPFQRRFLDSYFPMHIILDVDYSNSLLELEAITPEASEGLVLSHAGKQLELEAWFRGKLYIQLQFLKAGK